MPKKVQLQSLWISLPCIIMILAGSGSENRIGVFLVISIWFLNLLIYRKIYRKWLTVGLIIIGVDIISIVVRRPPNLFLYTYYELNKYIGLLFLFFADSYFENKKSSFYSVVIIVFLVDGMCLKDIANNGLGVRTMSALGSSYNTVAALNIIVMPAFYIAWKEKIIKNNRLFYLYIAIIGSAVFISGSRIAIPLLGLSVMWMLYIEWNNNHIKALLVVIVAIPVIIFVAERTGIFDAAYNRVFGQDTGVTSDNVRAVMYKVALDKFKNSNILFGIGDPKAGTNSYVHNFFIETLCLNGVLGLLLTVFYFVMFFASVVSNIITSGKKHFIGAIVVTGISYFGMAFLHPLMSSSMAFNYLFLISVESIMHMSEYNKENKLNINVDPR